jgi:hypothetical protein
MRPKDIPAEWLAAHRDELLRCLEENTDRSQPEVRQGLGPCWLWMGRTNGRGYGRTSHCGRRVFIHRLSYVLHKGQLSVGELACHTCDVPTCWHPGHLFAGTYRDNTQDALSKGRMATGERNGARLHPERVAAGLRKWQAEHSERRAFGERNGRFRWASLAPEVVLMMRWEREHGWTFRAIASAHGVGVATAYQAVGGGSWEWVG